MATKGTYVDRSLPTHHLQRHRRDVVGSATTYARMTRLPCAALIVWGDAWITRDPLSKAMPFYFCGCFASSLHCVDGRPCLPQLGGVGVISISSSVTSPPRDGGGGTVAHGVVHEGLLEEPPEAKQVLCLDLGAGHEPGAMAASLPKAA
ncbi:hypothetical protein CHU98_g10131 [Xylaria longipes]|nr:hypothetical protein CHU98_g10131 [Xylaria longipes]